MIMTYQEFTQDIIQTIQTELGSSVKVTIQEIIKNNDTRLDGLAILSSGMNISPTIYLNYYFRQYASGRPLNEICQEILTVYKENLPQRNIDISFFTDYEKVKKHIVFKLVNYERNRSLLSKIPHYRILDLAIVFCCLLQSNDNECATILIYNHHLTLWKITADDLYALSMKNTPVLLSYELRDMSDILKNLYSEEGQNAPDADSLTPMYVLSNVCKLNGSGCILYQDLLRSLADKISCDLYVLPSSIHEVLLIPAGSSDSSYELSKMVKEVNATQLSNEEILSDHVYYFSRETGKLSM